MIAAGAVGVNIEDAAEGGSSELRELGAQCARLGAAREAAEECDLDLFINARTDAFLLKAGARKQRLERAIERLHAYLEAGADGVFVPGLVDPDQIGRIADAVSAPLNVLAAPLTPSLQELGKLGVRRLSTGSAPARVALALVQRISAEVLEDGSLGSLWNEAIPYAEANRLFGG